MKTKLITVGAYSVNCAIIWGDAKRALIIDPGFDAPHIQNHLKTNNLTVAGYLLTHGHADHINALAELHASNPALIYLHTEDEKWTFTAVNQIPPHYPVPPKPHANLPTLGKNELKFSNPWKIADLTFQTLETPGHTPGGVCYWFTNENICFTGDTLFKGSCGRTDLPGGDGRILAKSLEKLAALPPETRIIPGHGDETTISHELKTNFFLQPH